MNPHKLAEQHLKENHFRLTRHGAAHDIYRDDETGMSIPLKRHDFDDNDLRYIKAEVKKIKQNGKRQ